MPNQFEEEEKAARKAKLIALAEELNSGQERFPFPGVNPESYAKLKASDEQFPGYVTPIDELIKRFEKEGCKVVFGNDKESGNVFILPSGSDDVERDSLFPRHLDTSANINETIRQLILANKE